MEYPNALIYDEVLNDLYDYFFVADLDNMARFKEAQDLDDDLLSPLVSSEQGDRIVEQGVMLALPGITNRPYHLLFKHGAAATLAAPGNQVIHHKGGYLLEVTSGRVHLFTVPLLMDWSGRRAFVQDNKPSFALPKGHYRVEVLAGFLNGDPEGDAAIELLFTKAAPFQPQIDLQYRFALPDC
ncbi:hypothetical protein [Gallaecimonas xiamenensis]|uniref:Uncharacterized protein n=1 Tax=Gallaecimonas xiamenensis 3-C-1 TaxID=745411 RepID=K2JW48_9GAMM|nr:hypothetical protein [Gallaecimonas xiamenensis]EKE69455.1 hypothetical protein B3C1_15127 [Gallaecimonas xiamenensis 3-C-1]